MHRFMFVKFDAAHHTVTHRTKFTVSLTKEQRETAESRIKKNTIIHNPIGLSSER